MFRVPAPIVVCSSISNTSLTSAFADAMEDDGTALDRGPRGSGSLAGLSTLLKYLQRAIIRFMETLHEPVTCVTRLIFQI